MYKIRVYLSGVSFLFFRVNYVDFRNVDGDSIFRRNTDKYGQLATPIIIYLNVLDIGYREIFLMEGACMHLSY